VCAGTLIFAQTQGTGQSAAGRARTAPAGEARPLRVLFLGQEGEPHPSATVFQLVSPTFARRGIQLTHVWTPDEALTTEKLAHYDALMIYGSHKTLTAAQEQALLQFVESGKGLVALHSAAGMFSGSGRYAALIGAQVQSESAGDFTAEIVQPSHPVMQGLQPFAASDQTFVFGQSPGDRTVLMERVDGQSRVPQAWVRTQGKGRVFYTAYGHDQRTWGNPAFQRLLEQGLAWTVGDVARTAWQGLNIPDVAYVDGFNVPNYENRNPAPKYQLPFTPEDSMKFIQVPAEFKLELFANEPDIIKPITFSFDERGRLWIVEAIDYPNQVLNGAPGNDRIKILEDTDGDGRADKFTVFAEHLNIPTSLTFANGGVIVAAAPNILFLKDTNGDDKADVRQVLSTGWGISDTHAVASNLQYAPDNYIWGVVGYSGFNGDVNGKHFQFAQAAYRFKPDGSGLEHMTTTTNNTWGLGFSETFDVFGSTANNDPSWYMAIPNRYFDGVQGLPAGRGSGPGYQSNAQFYAAHYVTPYIRQVDVQGGYTAAAGHYLYTARSFPKKYWNRIAFITEPTAHLIGQAVMEGQGAGFVARDAWNLMAGAEEWVAPVHAQVGPDGAVWVADWYNFIAQHNPTPVGHSNGKGNAYETSMRDHSRGRIYRVVYKNAPAARKRSLSKTDIAGLLSALSSDNMLWRLHAQRLIVERGQKDVIPQLVALVRNTSVDEVGTNGGAMHALWALHGLGELSGTTSEAYRTAVQALAHPAAGVRKAAAMVLPKADVAAQAIINAGLLQDRDPHTRLAAVLAIAEMPASAAVARGVYKASQAADNYTDRWLSRALYVAAMRHKENFLTEYRADPAAVPPTALPIALRIGNTKPDWRSPDGGTLAADWKDMQVPGNWEARGLPDFDGVVWFTRTFDASSAAAMLSLGRISNAAEVWVNGLSLALAPPPAPPAAAPGAAAPGGGRGAGPGGRGAAAAAPPQGRGNVPPLYALPEGTLRSGTNAITVRIQNNRNDGGFLGAPESMYLQVGESRTPLAGTWKYRVERQTNAGALYSKPGELAAHVALASSTGTGSTGPVGAAAMPVVAQAPDIVLQLGVVPNQMKFDKTELIVGAGQLVEIRITNPDAMQHNFVLGAAGALDQIGAAADDVAKSPTGQVQQYVPDTPLVLFSTKLIDPGQTLIVQFRAPAQQGQYPFVCTFPAHWRVMNGVLTVGPQVGGRGRGQ
jgi:putative membrane-bound dehydrogenase-like protein